MKKTNFVRCALRGGSALRALALFGAGVAMISAAPAFAQDQPAEAAPSDEAADDNSAIIVTGSRIIAPNLTSTVPITSVEGAEFFKTGAVSVGDTLNELPALRSTFSTANSTRFLGTAGLNLLDLRGLGTQRTLVLVNGRRHVGSDILSNAVSVDTNTIPTDLIERIDVITGGESAVYGSDAIAGVVNFILKDDYDGIETHMQGGISQYGDAGSYYGSVLAGKNFADGRGNIAANFEYARQSDYYGSDRPNIRNNNGFVIVDTDPEGSDGIPDRVFSRDIRSTTIANTGSLSFASGRNFFPIPPGSPPGTLPVANPNAGICGRDAGGAPFNCTFIFTDDGGLVPQTGQRVGLGPNGSFLGGNGTNFREGKQLVLQPRQDRYSGNLIGHFEISPAFVPFFEGKFVHIKTTGSTSGPAFFQGATLDGFLEQPRLDNPFLSTQARALITSQILAANPAAVITDATRFSLRKNLLDLGVRNEASTRDTYRIVAGIRGDLGSDWKYEISGNYGEFKEKTRVEGNLNIQRFLLAMDSTRNGAGAIVCRSRIDPAAGDDAVVVDDPAVLAADIAACQPLNPFGSGNISDAARNYVIQDTTSVGKITQAVVSGFVSGNSSKWFELPGGPVYFAAGGEYRRETNRFRADPLVEAGYTFYNALPSFSPPSFEVKEAYAEIRLPLLKDVPFFQELTVSGAGRVADYKGSTGTVYAYDGAVAWSPIGGLVLRGNYSHSVRAPNLTELYSAQGQNFAPAFVDPCSKRNIGTGSSMRAANCAAAGIPAAYDYVYGESLEILTGGNPDLKAETSNSYNIGGVLTPSFIPGFSLSVDYYNITVNKVISTPDAQAIANNCYDLAPGNFFCSLFQRAGAGGGPNDEEQFRIIEGSLSATSLNFAKLKARGIDVNVSYRHNFEGFAELSSTLAYTHVLQRDDFVDQSDPTFADQNLGELGDPKDAFNWNVDAKFGPLTVGYQMRYIGHMVLNEYENIFSVQGRPPENADYADRIYYPAVFYHDIRFGLDVNEKFNFYTGVDNVANRLPPLGVTGVGEGSGIYSARGRFFYAGVTAKF